MSPVYPLHKQWFMASLTYPKFSYDISMLLLLSVLLLFLYYTGLTQYIRFFSTHSYLIECKFLHFYVVLPTFGQLLFLSLESWRQEGGWFSPFSSSCHCSCFLGFFDSIRCSYSKQNKFYPALILWRGTLEIFYCSNAFSFPTNEFLRCTRW